MIGRAAYHDPATVLIGDDGLWDDDFAPDPFAVVEAMRPYIADHLAAGGRLHQVTRHMLGLFQGRPGARGWRRVLSEGSGGGLDLLDPGPCRASGRASFRRLRLCAPAATGPASSRRPATPAIIGGARPKRTAPVSATIPPPVSTRHAPPNDEASPAFSP